MVQVGDLPIGTSNGGDLDILLRTAHLHVPETMPAGVICRNCSWPYPCPTRIACDRLLDDHGNASEL